VREADLDIHQAEGGARFYWQSARASLEVSSAKVTHTEDSCANLGHGAVSPDSQSPGPRRPEAGQESTT